MSETSHKAASYTLREIASWQPGRGSADRDFFPDILAGKFVKRRYMYDENCHIREIINLD